MKKLLTLVIVGAIGMSVAMAQDSKRIVLPKKPNLKVAPEKKKKPTLNFGVTKSARITGVITETSWADRRVKITSNSGREFFVMIPAVVTIAGRGVDVHRDSGAFRRHFAPDATIVVVENRRVRPDLIEARDVLAPRR